MIRVLIVDDSQVIAFLLTAIIQDTPDLEVIGWAKNGQEALEMADSLNPDLITMDIRMPIMDGLKLVSMVRNDPNYKETPIIVITTEGATEDRERALALGANEYITKPIQTMQILETVKKLIG